MDNNPTQGDQGGGTPTDPNAGGMPAGDQPITPPTSTPMDQPVAETPTPEAPSETPATPDTGIGGEQPGGMGGGTV